MHSGNRICVRSSSNVYNQSLVASMLAARSMGDVQQWTTGLVNNFARKPAGGDTDQLRAVATGQCDVAPENRHIGMVFQDVALFPHLTIARNIAFGLQGWSRAERHARGHVILTNCLGASSSVSLWHAPWHQGLSYC